MEIHEIKTKMNLFWRIAHKLDQTLNGTVGGVTKILYKISCIVGSHQISFKATIGKNTIFVHSGLGCVIHEKSVIGDDCVIFQNVTIGSKWQNRKAEGNDFPKIGSNVVIGAGAVILGNITIGDNVNIGANAVVLMDVPDDSTVVGVPARIIEKTITS